MRLSQSHGILKAGEHVKVTIYITSSDDWPLDPAEYSRKRIKLVVENLKIPEYIQPKNKLEGKRMSREIFHNSAANNPLLRMFTRVNLILVTVRVHIGQQWNRIIFVPVKALNTASCCSEHKYP
ncbi:unnamed protein product [Angiostrongylus costaricensis]|uniref:MSP domain-containing protein n=1 Tax=Angiostrongylus costaricensis TaxID=334426 RepID=A0A0R3PHA0_ANGCS|nr:unnamed protein product [Angiostrongylus costaricensis]